jgi:hypothetical protein
MSDRIRQTGRLIYLLALFQLAGGPLVIGGVMLAAKLCSGWQQRALAATMLDVGAFRAEAEQVFEAGAPHALIEGISAAAPSSDQKPAPPRKAKDAKGKLWTINELGTSMHVGADVPLIACLPSECSWLVTRSHPPPAPPPRAA